jgi:hypothetical protein
VEGHVNYLLGAFDRSSAACEKAERIFVEGGRSATWELNSVRYFFGNALRFQGRWRELASRLDGWIEDAEERNDLYAWSGLMLIRVQPVTLAAGDVKGARREVAAAMERWLSDHFGVQSFLATILLMSADLHEGDADAAVARMDEMWLRFSRSLMTRIQVCRISALQQDAHAALAAAAQARPGSRQTTLLHRALADARKLRREAMPWSRAYALYIEAAVAHLRGDDTTAVASLRGAVAALESCHLNIYAAGARHQLGTLLGGDQGRLLVEATAATLRRQGVQHPERLVPVIAPGFG